MARWQWTYLIGMATALCLFILGQLIWLPDPLRISGGYFWIDVLELALYLLLVPSLLWTGAAAVGIVSALRRRGSGARTALAIARRALVLALAAGATACMLVLVGKRELQLTFVVAFIVLLTAAWLIALWDIAAYEREQHKTSGKRLPWRSLLSLLVSGGLLSGLFWPTDALVTYPGLTLNMHRYAAAEGFSPSGSIAGVLIFERPAFPVDWLYARIFPHYSFRPVERLGMSLGAYELLVRDLKREADEMGAAVAFKAAGLGSGAIAHGAKIVLINQRGPAADLLRPGDVIVSINGGTVATTLELADRMRLIKPGDLVSVMIRRGEETLTVIVPTVAHAEEPDRPLFGIQVVDELRLDLPLQVSYHNYMAHEGGPSHGAALALALLDQLTPDGIARGNAVVVTGTVAADGAIGRIGGIRQKAYAAARTGADVFFVPVGQEMEAALGAPHLRIVPVRTLDDMVQWLDEHPK